MFTTSGLSSPRQIVVLSVVLITPPKTVAFVITSYSIHYTKLYDALYQSRELGYNAIGLIESPKTGGTFNDRRLLLSLSRQWQRNDNWDLQGLVSYYHRDFDSGIVTAFPAGAFNGRDPDGMHYGYGVEQVNRNNFV